MAMHLVGGEEARKLDPRNLQWPSDSIAAVEENGEGVEGISVIVQLPHIEGTWVKESKRGGTLAYRLVSKVEKVLRMAGRTHAFAFVDPEQPEVMDYMQRIGYKPVNVKVMTKEL